MSDWREAIDGYIDSIADDLRRVRRHLHAHPEPSLEEYETTLYLAGRLQDAGLSCRLAPSRRGIIAEPEQESAAHRVAMRADIDALRLHDAKEVDYRSTREGLMHACGHDAHATMVLGASLALHACRELFPWPVAWRAIFQPAEELGDGAAEMVAAGAVEGVDAIVALHVDPETSVGRVGQRSGPLTACCSDLSVTVQGRGGHAARPHHTIDPIAAAVQFAAAIYQLVPRSIDAREPVVVTFGAIEGGSSPNVIPDRVTLRGTIRTFDRRVSTRVEARINAIARGISEATRATIDVRVDHGTDAVVNDPDVTEVCVRAAGEVLGADHLDPIPWPSMGGEDFSGYLAHAPGCMLRLGVAAGEDSRHLLHSPRFDIDERALAIGAKILARSLVLLAERRSHVR